MGRRVSVSVIKKILQFVDWADMKLLLFNLERRLLLILKIS